MYSPLLFLFDDPRNTGWVKPTGTMVQSDGSGNGFGWGQLSHLLGWVLFVGDLEVEVHVPVVNKYPHVLYSDLMYFRLVVLSSCFSRK